MGTLLPSRCSLPGNRHCLREGPPQPPAVSMNTKQKLSPPGELHESVLLVFFFFLNSVFFSLPHLFFSFFPPSPLPRPFMTGTLLYVEKKSKENPEVGSENKQVGVWELLSVSFFWFQELLSALTLLTQVFVHLWRRISGSASLLCAKISTANYL